MDDLDLIHVPYHLRDCFRAMLHMYASMWDGTIGEINAVSHRVDVVPRTRPIAKVPYRADHKVMEID